MSRERTAWYNTKHPVRTSVMLTKGSHFYWLPSPLFITQTNYFTLSPFVPIIEALYCIFNRAAILHSVLLHWKCAITIVDPFLNVFLRNRERLRILSLSSPWHWVNHGPLLAMMFANLLWNTVVPSIKHGLSMGMVNEDMENAWCDMLQTWSNYLGWKIWNYSSFGCINCALIHIIKTQHN